MELLYKSRGGKSAQSPQGVLARHPADRAFFLDEMMEDAGRRL